MFSFFGGSNEAEGDENASNAPTSATSSAPAFNLWDIAASVSNTVKQTAGELVRTVQETDWKNELSAFGKEVETDAKTISSSAAGLVEALPVVDLHMTHGDTAREAHQDEASASSSTAASLSIPGLANAPHVAAALGSTLTTFGKSLFVGTQELVSEVREAVQGEIEKVAKEGKRGGRGSRAAARLGAVAASAKYSRFDSEVAAMQRDSSTYCDEPEDAADYSAWCQSFSLADAKPEIYKLSRENAFMGELQQRIVPILVEYEVFWSRYFYRLHKLQQKEQQRQALAQRASAASKDDDLGWDDLEEDGQSQSQSQTQQPEEPKATPAEQAQQPAVAAAAAAVAALAVTSSAEPAAPAAPAAASDEQQTSAANSTRSDPEPALDTASDASGNRDWTMVSSKRPQSPTPPAPAPAATAEATAPADTPEVSSSPAAAAAAAPAAGKPAAGSNLVKSSSFDSLDFGEDDLEPAAGKAAAGAAAGEEVDEDWGNWD